MSGITFGKDEKALIVRKLQLYFSEELQQPLGQFCPWRTPKVVTWLILSPRTT